MLMLTVSNAVYVLCGYVMTVWLARELGPAEYALYGIATAIITVVQLLVARGVPVAATVDIAAGVAPTRQILAAATKGTALAAVIVGGVAIATAPLLAAALDKDALQTCLLIGAGGAVTYGVHALLLAVINGKERFGRQAAAHTAYAAIRLTTVVAGGVGYGAKGAVAGFVLAPLLAAPTLLTRIERARGEPTAVDGPSASGYVRRSVPLVIGSAAVALLLTVDLLAFARIASEHAAGVYTAAGTIAHVPFFLLGSAPLVLLPRVAGQRQLGHDELCRHLREGFAAAWALLAFPTAALAACGAELLPMLFGSEYRGEEHLVALLAGATAGITIHATILGIDAGRGRLRTAVTLGLTAVATIAVAATVGGEHWGATGAAAGAAVGGLGLAAVHLASLRVALGPCLPWGAIGGTTVLAVAAAGPAWFAREQHPLMLLLLVTCGLVYIAACIRAGWFALRAGTRRPIDSIA